jgi:tetratricopeptide (TPR) repeat protein
MGAGIYSRSGFRSSMPKTISQYSVFIGSPGGLTDERKKFRASLEKCSLHHGRDKDVLFNPVGWEDTIGGAGRPQALINEDLRQCDYAVFVLHDRWGSPTGTGHTSGTEEEWALAEELYRANKIRNIALFFKQIKPGKLADPGDQLKPVLAFKKKIEEEKRYLFKQYTTLDEFTDTLDGHLAQWLREHDKAKTSLSLSDQISTTPAGIDVTISAPSFDYWITEAKKSVNADNAGALFCSSKALDAAKTDVEWAKARNTWGVAQFHLGRVDESLSAFAAIEERFLTSFQGDPGLCHAKALTNKGITLTILDRNDDAIAAYNELLARFGASTELPLREHVAMALFNKGVTLDKLGRSEDEIEIYDDLLARFNTATELSLREHVAKTLVNKGNVLNKLGRGNDEIAVYDDLIARFGTTKELSLRENVATALINKVNAFYKLGRRDDEIAACDDLLARFGAATEIALRERVANALCCKGFTLDELGHCDDAIAIYDELLSRFSAASELPLREHVAMALGNKGVTLDKLGRSDDAIVVNDDLLARFGSATELSLREQVARGLLHKGIALNKLGRSDDAIAVFDDLLARFGSATELPLRKEVARATQLRSTLFISKTEP